MQSNKSIDINDCRQSSQLQSSPTTIGKSIKATMINQADGDFAGSGVNEATGVSRKDIKIQRKKHGPSLIQAKWSGGVDSRGKGDAGGDDDSSCSSFEENNQDPKPFRLHLKPAGKAEVSQSNSKSMSQNMPQEFKNHKKITSLDEFYVKNTFMKPNSRDPYDNKAFDFESEGFLIEVTEARFLPDTVNFVKVKGMVYEIGGQRLTDIEKSVLRIEGDINQIALDFTLTVKDLDCQNYEQVYFLLFWLTFEDIFGDDEVEFTPVIFGFSVVKLFKAKSLKSEGSNVGLNSFRNGISLKVRLK